MISNQVLDFYDDEPRAVLKKVASLIPNKFLNQELTSKGEPNKFALQVLTKQGSALQKYPIGTEADTMLSSVYFQETHSRLPKEAQVIAASFIKEACKQFAIKSSDAVQSLASDKISANMYNEANRSFAAQFEKKANVVFDNSRPEVNSKTFYALPKFKKYAMPNEDYVKKAEAYFDENYKHLEVSDRVEYSHNTMTRAKELDCSITSDLIHKYASKKYAANPEHSLLARKPFVKEATHRRVLDKMKTFIPKTTPQDFAQALYSFDKKAGLDKYYDGKLKDPYQSLLTGKPLEKYARYSYVENYTGTTLTKKQLENTFEKKADKISKIYGKNLSDSLISQGVAAFEALPNDTKEIIGKIAVGA